MDQLVYQVRVDTSDAPRTIAEIEASLKAATRAAKEAVPNTDAFRQAIARVGAERQNLKAASQELRGVGTEANKSLGGINENAKFAAGSLGELRQRQKQLNEEIQRVAVGSEEYKRLNGELLKVNETVSATQRELRGAAAFQEQVAAAIRKANGPLDDQLKKQQELNDILAELRKQQADVADKGSRDYKALSAAIGNVQKELKDVNANVASLKQNSGGLSGAFDKASASTKLFGVALIGTGIGAIVKLIGELIAKLQEYSPVIDFAEKVTDSFGAVVGSVVTAFQRLLKGDFDGAVKAITTELVDNTVAAFNLRGELQELEDQQRDFGVVEADNARKIARLLIISRDRTKSERERLAALEEASRIEKSQVEERIRLAKEDLRLAEERFKKSGSNDALEQEIAQKKIALINAQREGEELLEKITVRKNGILEKSNEEANKAAEDEAKRRAARVDGELRAFKSQQALEAERLALRKDAEAQVRRVEIEAENARAELNARQLNGEKVLASERLLIEQRLQNQLTEIRAAEVQRQQALDADAQNAQADNYSKFRENIEAITSGSFARLSEEQQAALLKEVEDYANSEQGKTGILATTEEQRNAIRRAQASVASSIQFQREQDEIQGLYNVLGVSRQVAGEQSGIGATLAAFQQSLTAFQVINAQARALSEGTASGAALPFPANVIAIGTIIAQILTVFASFKSLISGQKAPAAPKFASGGLLPDGPLHSQGGIALMAGSRKVGEIEGGEPVLTKGVSRNPALLAAASQINVLGGGRPLVPSSFMAFGGLAPIRPQVTPQEAAGALSGSAGLEARLDRLDETLGNLKIGVAWRDFDEARTRYDAREARSEYVG